MSTPIQSIIDSLSRDLCRIHVEYRMNQYKTHGVYKLHRTDSIIYDTDSSSYQSSLRVKYELELNT